jgi:hypothetical protein
VLSLRNSLLIDATGREYLQFSRIRKLPIPSLCEATIGAILGRFSNKAAVAVWWTPLCSVESIMARSNRRGSPSGRRKHSAKSRVAGPLRLFLIE